MPEGIPLASTPVSANVARQGRIVFPLTGSTTEPSGPTVAGG